MIKSLLSAINPNKKSFTLVELIIIVIIVGILASLGLTQYNLMVEKSRLVEAKVRISTMRQIAYSYYLENGTVDTMQPADFGMNGFWGSCQSTEYFTYWFTSGYGYQIGSARCATGGKAPNASRPYLFGLVIGADVSKTEWHCRYDDGAKEACFGFPSW